MFDKLAAVEARWEELNEQMAQPDVATDHLRLQQIAREQRELDDVVLAYRTYKEVQRQIADTQGALVFIDRQVVPVARLGAFALIRAHVKLSIAVRCSCPLPAARSRCSR